MGTDLVRGFQVGSYQPLFKFVGPGRGLSRREDQGGLLSEVEETQCRAEKKEQAKSRPSPSPGSSGSRPLSAAEAPPTPYAHGGLRLLKLGAWFWLHLLLGLVWGDLFSVVCCRLKPALGPAPALLFVWLSGFGCGLCVGSM